MGRVLIQVFALTFALVGINASLRADVVFDAQLDFPVNAPNPNGVWSYGYRSTLSGALTLFDEYTTGGTPQNPTFGWRRTNHSLGAPIFWRNLSGATILGVPNSWTVLHPGGQGDDTFAVLRFTAPSTAGYSIAAEWLPGDGGTTDNYVLRNGAILHSQLGQNASDTYTNNLINLLAGDTVELVVGNANGFFSDTTPVQLRLVQFSAVPEPSPLLLTVLTASCLMFRRRSMKFPQPCAASW